jgi:processive 1,2-diacylglycerol beta-glucosyltransferase
VALSPIPEGERPDPTTELVPVLDTTERALLPIVKVTLEQERIDYMVEDRGFSEQIFGRRSTATIGETSEPFVVLVRAEDADRARRLLEGLESGAPAQEVAPTEDRFIQGGAHADRQTAYAAPPEGSAAGEAHIGVHLRDARTGDSIGSLTEAQFERLAALLERESTDDDDYYVDNATLELLAREGVDEQVIAMLREALGRREGMDVQWRRRGETGS